MIKQSDSVTNLFLKWALKCYGEQNSTEGDFVRDAVYVSASNLGFPEVAEYAAIRDHLLAKGACTEAIQAFERLWSEYEQELLKGDLHEDGGVCLFNQKDLFQMKELRDYLWDGLDYDRFATVAIWPQDEEDAVILRRSRYPKDDPCPWCVQYRGSGHYFGTIVEAMEYCDKRKFVQEIPIDRRKHA